MFFCCPVKSQAARNMMPLSERIVHRVCQMRVERLSTKTVYSGCSSRQSSILSRYDNGSES